MNRGVIEKAAREVWPLTLVLGGALLLAEGLLAYVLCAFRREIGDLWGRIEVAHRLLQGLLGSDLAGEIGPHAFEALPWVHPIVLAIVWAHELTVCSRFPSGEVDRGTVDLLLGLPVSRWQVYGSETVVFLLSGVLLFLMGLAGNCAGSFLAGSWPGAPGSIAAVLANGYCLYLGVGGINYFFSALSDRRGRAVGWGLAVVLGSFLLSFLAPFWEPARRVLFLSVLDYYRPAAAFQEGSWPLGDMAVLVAAGGLFWGLGAVILRGRDLRTV